MSSNVERDTDYIIGDYKTCGNRQKEFALWIPVIQGNSTDIDGQYQWIDDRSGTPNNIVQNLKWSRSEPNGYELEKCVVARVKETRTGKQMEMYDDDCSSYNHCCICNMPVVQKYRLRGQDLFDGEYYLNLEAQKSKSTITFDGSFSEIRWHIHDGKTELIDARLNYSIEFGKLFGLLKSKSGPGERFHQLIFTNVSS